MKPNSIGINITLKMEKIDREGQKIHTHRIPWYREINMYIDKYTRAHQIKNYVKKYEKIQNHI